ncbi:putative transcription factor Homeodomain-TALE-BEL family [Lupinus albus]|uniref:Putative transcription factor Homeodomain-TALE-BEL family n=1 Tax=Lupinus albus TaxID=3870 RepID=A0A6A4NHD3_LUPAL|nr:putative transcription factor Homeodomain-TALE-BEL family [Lupinus albus]
MKRDMATYFNGSSSSEIQSSAEGLQTLYLMNPNYVPYSDAPQHQTPNMFLINPNTAPTTTSPSHALNLANFTHAPSPSNNMTGATIPLSNTNGSTNTNEISNFHDFAAMATAPRVHYNMWGFDQTPWSAAAVTIAASPSNNSGYAITASTAAADISQQVGFHRPNNQQQGLSLSLSSQQPDYRSLSGEVSAATRGSGILGMNNINSNNMILGSKYLKAAHELLDEVVNVGKGIFKGESIKSVLSKEKKMKTDIESISGIGGDGSSGGGQNSESKQGVELSTTQRQELQMKKSKLVSMLDEVEQRYRHYHHQMQIVITSFEQVGGYGAAKSYTSLALKTISKQFRCLKDAISSQIRAISKTLGEDDCLGVKVEGSRLRYVDHHLRQQKTLQQLGMIQHNAWRPQRGLPERAVSILRAWLFEHFLHPYPKDSDKVMLAKQTGLTRSQVSNWFINARVRLWKPMVEEMYLEEVKEQEQNRVSQDNTNRSKDQSSKELKSVAANNADVLQSKSESSFNNQNTSPTEISNCNNLTSTSPMGVSTTLKSQYGNFHLAGSSHDMQNNPNKRRSSELHNPLGSGIFSVDMDMKPGETNREITNTKFGIENHGSGGGYVPFSIEDIGRFNNETENLAPRFDGNGVSLTLGLPRSENFPLSGTQHEFLSENIHLGDGRIHEMGTNENEFRAINSTPPSSHSGTSFESIDIQNRKRFSAQLLRDFVA